jgi:GT2 family glycosyltransferase
MLVESDKGILQVKTAGGSCLLIKRKVLETLSKPVFRFIYKDCHPPGVYFSKGKDMMSEDYYFCAKAIDKGFKVMCDTSVVCRHQKSILF